MRRLGNPERAPYRIIHVTGTNGKGSVCAMIDACLRQAGYRVGLYMSPYIEEFTERIQVNRVPIAPEALAALVGEVRPHAAAMVDEGLESPTEFEVTTGAAFLYYARQNLDWLVLEVGLGGRFDATNIVKEPVVSVITNVSLDHTSILGETVEKIARDKAGIIKSGVPCVTGVTGAGPLAMIRAEAERQEAPLYRVLPAWQAAGHDLTGQVFNLVTRKREYHGLRLGLLGRHQLANAACAVTALEAAESWSLRPIPPDAIRSGLAVAQWPGRLEVLHGATGPGPVVAIDGAHNAAGAEVLSEAVADYFEGRRVILVAGMLGDKDIDAVLTHVVPLASVVIATTPNSPRALAAAALGQRVRALGATPQIVPEVEPALDLALSLAGPEDAVLVAGSLYLAGPARTYLRRRLAALRAAEEKTRT